MKQKLESILRTGRSIFLAGLGFLTVACQTVKFYVEPRVGAVIPVAAKEQTYDPSLTIGGAVGLNIEKIGIGLEAGLDYFHSSGEYIETDSILPRINLSYSPLKQKAKAKPYVMAGINVLGEFSAIDLPEFDVHEEVSNTTLGIEAGVGVTIFDRIHTRLSYTGLPASENVKGIISLIGGYRFLFGEKIWDAEK